jgi:hypothetical protein
VHYADGTVIDDGYLAICMNTNPYTFLGNRPLNLAPEATLDRGLVMTTFRSLRIRPLFRVVGSALGIGRPPNRLRGRYLDRHTDLDKVWVRGHGPFPCQVDGDFLGELESAELRHEPGILRLVLPA